MTQLDRIERLIRQLIADRPPYTVHEAMCVLNVHSQSTFYRLMSQNGIKPIRRGTYARKDIHPLTENKSVPIMNQILIQPIDPK